MSYKVEHSCWTEEDTANNGIVTVTKAAEDGKSHFIIGIIASFSVANSGKLFTLTEDPSGGNTTKISAYVQENLITNLPGNAPIEIAEGKAIEAKLLASGTADQIGAVTLIGYTI